MNKGLDKMEVFDAQKFVELVSKLESNSEQYLVKIDTRIFPLLKLKKKKFSYLFSLPFSLYTSHDTRKVYEQLLSQLLAEKSDSLTINFPPFADLTEREAREIAIQNKMDVSVNTCHVLHTNRSLEEIIMNFNATRKKHIKRYQKAGQLRVFHTTEPSYFDQYYALYLDSVNRWGQGGGAYSKELIASLHLVPGIRMWVAEFEGKVVSAMICIYHKDHVFDWLAASLINDELKKLYAPVAVQYEVIRHAAESGLQYVNMGASVNLAGVSDFKDSWGATEQQTFSFQKKSMLFFLSKKLVKSFKKIRS